MDIKNALEKYIGVEIESVRINMSRVHGEDVVEFKFVGRDVLAFESTTDCCAQHYFSTDDDLPYYAGSVFLGVEIVDAPTSDTEHTTHEIQFLDVRTSKGVFQIAAHNEHNGYYGGIHLYLSGTSSWESDK